MTSPELNKLAQMLQACISGVQSTADAQPELARALTRIAGLLWSARDDLERLALDPSTTQSHRPVPAARSA